ncbi:hypothetical protein B0I32_15121 [Nonomuraea fuscirosea]|uniref:Secreted protein n=1 Tax=Nonomuraea fuscirosea TaxID=1291556 RepID=A0A2T0LMZ5_9ACTN|nr:hypothetical protein [Nonomuraea fuscirosea]PRX44434.1 hypothetical protein B0I32_15121 [Nonomuraea fuscirosea]
MKIFKKMMIVASMAGLATSATIALAPSSAYAEVWNCAANVDVAENKGESYCVSGYGSYHVRVECNSAHWPYTRTIDGPIVYKPNNTIGATSTQYGTPNGCHVTKAWTVVL